jgi:hypothetical protein
MNEGKQTNIGVAMTPGDTVLIRTPFAASSGATYGEQTRSEKKKT